MWEFVSCKKCAHCGVSGKAAYTRVKTLMTRANQFIDYYIIRTVQCCPASPARTSVRMWTYVCGFTHTCERTILFPDARRNYLQEAAWVSEKRLSKPLPLTKYRWCVYISRTCGKSLVIIWY